MVKFQPSPTHSPAEDLPAQPDFHVITDRMSSEEGHVKDQGKIENLYRPRDEVYKTRQVRFHRKLE